MAVAIYSHPRPRRGDAASTQRDRAALIYSLVDSFSRTGPGGADLHLVDGLSRTGPCDAARPRPNDAGLLRRRSSISSDQVRNAASLSMLWPGAAAITGLYCDLEPAQPKKASCSKAYSPSRDPATLRFFTTEVRRPGADAALRRIQAQAFGWINY